MDDFDKRVYELIAVGAPATADQVQNRAVKAHVGCRDGDVIDALRRLVKNGWLTFDKKVSTYSRA